MTVVTPGSSAASPASSRETVDIINSCGLKVCHDMIRAIVCETISGLRIVAITTVMRTDAPVILLSGRSICVIKFHSLSETRYCTRTATLAKL